MPSWKKVIVSGSDAILNSVTASNGFFGTASWATNAVSASYVATLSAAGNDQEIQYNSGSVLSSNSSFKFNYVSQSLILGSSTTATGQYSVAYGQNTQAIGQYSHAKGFLSIASGAYSHAEGYATTAIGQASHAEGISTVAIGAYSYAGGYGTIASGSNQFVIGQHNTQNNTTDLFIIGSGYYDTSAPYPFPLIRRDVLTVGTASIVVSGSVNISGSLNVNGGITGSLFGTSSWATNALTASFVTSASFATTAVSSSFISTTSTSSDSTFFIPFVDSNNISTQHESLYTNSTLRYNPALDSLTVSNITASLFGTASWAQNVISASFASTASFAISSSFATNASTASLATNALTASLATNASNILTENSTVNSTFYIPFVDSDNTPADYEKLYTSNGISYNASTKLLTATLAGTASWATNASTASIATSASFATTASYVTASGVFGPYGSNSVISSSFAVSASWAPGGTPGGASGNIQFKSGSEFGGSNKLSYSYISANSDADQLFHQYNYDFASTGANNNHPASFVTFNSTSPNNQKLGLSHFQILQAGGIGATTIYRWNAVPGGTGTDLQMYGFKCDYSLLLVDTDLGSGNNVASRIGTLKAAWSWSTGNTPALNDDFVDGDLVYNELGLVIFTLNWNDPYMELQMDTTNITAGNTIFQGIFTNFGIK